jgi:hypothetical protein
MWQILNFLSPDIIFHLYGACGYSFGTLYSVILSHYISFYYISLYIQMFMEESLFCYVVYNESLTVNQVQGGIDI